MRTLLILALLAVGSLQAKEESSFDAAAKMATQVGFSLWNGFTRGFYHGNSKIDSRCLGSWLISDAKTIDAFTREAVENSMELNLPKISAMLSRERVQEVVMAFTDMLFLNQEFCKFQEVFKDLFQKCIFEGGCTPSALIDNFKANYAPIMNGLNEAYQVFLIKDLVEEDAINDACDKVAEGLGTAIAYLVGF